MVIIKYFCFTRGAFQAEIRPLYLIRVIPAEGSKYTLIVVKLKPPIPFYSGRGLVVF